MGDIICKWRVANVPNLIDLVRMLPHEELPNDDFRDRMGPGFMRTPYQLACQLGLYHIDENNNYIPRFRHNLTAQEAEDYLHHWILRYYAPNPYTPSFRKDLTETKALVPSLVEYAEKFPNANYEEACRAIYGEEVGNTGTILGAINSFSRVLAIDKDHNLNLLPNYKDILMADRNNKTNFFHTFDEDKSKEPMDSTLQIIYFGAPGTGKSFEIKKEVKGKPHFRTTFHPDTDYASFVGSYKPISVKGTLHAKIGGNEMILKDNEGNNMHDTKIVYRYVFQAFLKAYVKAWQEMTKEQPENVYLIIEEINRGNCAQIFGDIFQLLDRNDKGFSDYPIVADDDLKQELSQVLGSLDIKNADFINSLYPGQGDIVAQIKSGDILLLPNNLFIRATMNTSDQSLFPIDSAFKRRWDWRYVNIKNHEEENYVISFSNGNKYSWWDFLTEINSRIEGGDIQQEDKKLGYFFAKAKNGEISAETFLSKIIFFLYNDVFKDFGLDLDFFKDEDGNTMSFASYFDHRGKIIENRVEKFLNNLGINPLIFSEEEEMKQDKLESSHDGSKDLRSRKLTIRFKDGEIIQENTRFESFRKALEKIGLDKAEQITSEKEYVRLNSPFVTKEPTQEIEEAPDYSYVQSGEYYILKGANTRTLRNVLNIISDRLDLGLTITVE